MDGRDDRAVTTTIATANLIAQIVRLRRAELSGAPSEVADVREDLEAAVGPAVGQDLALTLLGVGRRSFNRHIAARDIPLLEGPGGRDEVPLDELVRILLVLEQDRSEGAGRAALSKALHRRRAEARERLPDGVLEIPPSRDPSDRAERLDLVMHRAAALLLDDQMVIDAERRLRRMQKDGKIDARWAHEWQWTFSFPVVEIARVISSDDARGRDLRQSSPFVGALSYYERERTLALLEAADSHEHEERRLV